MKLFWTPLLMLALPAAAQEDERASDDKKPPRAKFTVSKETTYATEPVDARTGWVDFETAINRRLSQKVTPANNSAALLWKAFGPTPEGGGVCRRSSTSGWGSIRRPNVATTSST